MYGLFCYAPTLLLTAFYGIRKKKLKHSIKCSTSVLLEIMRVQEEKLFALTYRKPNTSFFVTCANIEGKSVNFMKGTK